jgi:transposase
MEEITEEPVGLVERVCAIDIGKAELVACVRVPHASRPGRRAQEVREYATMTSSLLRLADWLHRQQIELVAMEATSDYWKPVFYLLEAEGFECWLLNAKHVKNVPGRPKTDKLDAVWLAKVVERGMCRPSLVHPKPIRQLRDVTRYRRSLVREQSLREAAAGKDPRRRADQAGLGHQQPARRLRPADAAGDDRRPARPERPGRDGPRGDAPQDSPTPGGADRSLR